MGDEPNKEKEAELNPNYAGYPSLEGLVQGYRNSGSEAKKWREVAEQRERQLQEYMTAGNLRQSIPDRSTDPNGRLTEFGIPVDALDEFVNQRLQQALQPIAATFTARSNVLSQYPDFQKFESDVAQFLESDSRLNQAYQRMFSADPAAAMEYAFLKFGDSRRRAGRTAEKPPEVEEETAHAQVPNGRTGEGRRPEGANNDIRSAWERFQKTGSSRDAEAFAKARLRTVIPEEFLRQ